ncbi:helix-turn-helix domain-containing protein [Mesorhizobium sp. BE184]|uniref:helix-turn-helix domain-containing protein n=1 Tax=Mesorhizobium sp. BE184 TaxID=2817714 RepID=UPI00286214BF|nr:helix-turn-helix domain-containing protein [Mesorhizobium sp. BE184]MDR7032416.1 chromosomal replication initiation ATPase DnaA [Mesorhizobium sp. BE184]
MFAVCGRATERGIRERNQPLFFERAPAKESKRDRLIAASIRWQRQRAEKLRADLARKEKIRAAVAAEKARWDAKLEAIKAAKPERRHHQEIISMVGAWHGVSYEEIMSPSRTNRITAARHDAIVAVWENCRLEGRRPNWCSMGRAFKRDHTVILYAMRRRSIALDKGRGE